MTDGNAVPVASSATAIPAYPTRPPRLIAPPRDDIVTTSTCPVCGTGFTRIRRQRYCTPACRQNAFRRRHQLPDPVADPVAPPGPRRRDVTVYTCPDCEQRYLGEQWCPDCARPCRRAGVGGLCPRCLLTELLGAS